jgi:hypothetical protein
MFMTLLYVLMKVFAALAMKPDQERVKTLLADTVTLLCRNGLHFQRQLRVQGVLGITVDDTDVFIVHINESFTEQGRGARLADFQGPLGSGFTAQLVATLSGQQAVSGVTVGSSVVSPVPKWQGTLKQKANEGSDPCPLTATVPMKRSKVDVQYPATVHDSKDLIKESMAAPQQVTVALPSSAAVAAQWQFDAASKVQHQNQRSSANNEATCYLAYSAGGGISNNSVSAINKRKANVYPPPQAMLAMSFGGLTSTVDYGNSVLQAATLQQTGRDLCSSNNVQTSSSASKLWNDGAGQLVSQPHSLTSDEQRLSASFDPITGCTTWTVQHLMDGQGVPAIKVDEPHQQPSSLDVVNVSINFFFCARKGCINWVNCMLLP